MTKDDSTERKYRYTYDGFGNLVLVTKPDTNTIEYVYNALNQMTQEKFDGNNFNDFEYDCCSLVKHQQTVGGSQEDPFELTYDKMKRMTKEQYPDSANPKTEYFDYEYDQAGRRVKMADPTYGRDDSKPMRWKYEEDGKVIKVGRTEDDNYLSSQGEDYGVMYDGRGRIWKVTYPGDDNQPVMEVEYQYTTGSQIAKIIARNLTDGAGTDIYCQEFEYDENGRKIRQVQKEKESDADTSAYYVVSFSYDSRDMLTEEKYVRWNSGTSTWDNMYWARYKYDTAGNMVHREVDQIVNGSPKQYADGPFTYSRGYQLTGFTRKGNFGAETRSFTLTYDANGNMTHIEQSATFTDTFYNITEMEFQFDEKNRMTHYRFGGSGSYFQIKYDALGRVRERVNLAPTTSKYYSDGRQLIQQLDNSDNVDFDYFRGPTGLMRQTDVDDSNKKRFYIKDPLGTVLALVNPSDLSVTNYNYNAWGEHLDKDDTDFPTDTNSMRYIGCRVEVFGDSTAQTDAIYHLDHRHYIPALQMFLSIDSLRITSSNAVYYPAYSYVSNLPTGIADPAGTYNGTRRCYRNSNGKSLDLGAAYGWQDVNCDVLCGQDKLCTSYGSGCIYFYQYSPALGYWHQYNKITVNWLIGQDYIKNACDLIGNNPGSQWSGQMISLQPELCCYLLDGCSSGDCQHGQANWELNYITVRINAEIDDVHASTGYNFHAPFTGLLYNIFHWGQIDAKYNCTGWQKIIMALLGELDDAHQMDCWDYQAYGIKLSNYPPELWKPWTWLAWHSYVRLENVDAPNDWYAIDPWYFGGAMKRHGHEELEDKGWAVPYQG